MRSNSFLRIIILFFTFFLTSFAENEKKPTVLIAILVRNKAHTLPYFLTFLENINYPKNRIHLWIYSDNNVDNSNEILSKWIASRRDAYHKVTINLHKNEVTSELKELGQEWSTSRFSHVIKLREKALNTARNIWADFVWMLDADVFITNPETLAELVTKSKTVVAPLLKSDGLYSNFWAGMTEDYYYLRTELYEPILYREEKGCFHVPMIHSSVLIDLRRHSSDFLSYDPENVHQYDGPIDDIIAFAIGANRSDIPLFICNDHVYGYIMVPLETGETITEDLQRLTNIKTEILSDNSSLPLAVDLEQFVQYPLKETLNVDQIYMINLERRPERRERMHRLFKELGILAKTVDAIDGRLLDPLSLKELGVELMPEYTDPYHKRPMTMGEVGCFLSHHNIWKEVLQNGYESIIVLEDDVRFEPFFRQKVTYILAELRNLNFEWDLVYLGRKRLAEKMESKIIGSKYLVHADYSYWTLGYILSANGAKKLVEAAPLKKLLPVDEYIPIMSDVHPRKDWKIHFNNRNLVTLSASPLLIYPMRYTGEDGYISDTEDSTTIRPETETDTNRDDL